MTKCRIFWARSVSYALAAAAFLTGCDKGSKPSAKSPDAVVSSTTVAANSAAGPPPGEKACFGCYGTGIVPCHAPGCYGGMVECPGPCLKLTRGSWIHMNVAGHPPTDLWQKFPTKKGGYAAFNQNHVGEVIVVKNGEATDTGPCSICGGKGKITCPKCGGQDKQPCEICQGSKFVPVAWTASDNPWIDSQPDLIRTRDGQVLLGKVAMSNGDDRGIRTRDGKFIHINASDILSSVGTNTTRPRR